MSSVSVEDVTAAGVAILLLVTAVNTVIHKRRLATIEKLVKRQHAAPVVIEKPDELSKRMSEIRATRFSVPMSQRHRRLSHHDRIAAAQSAVIGADTKKE